MNSTLIILLITTFITFYLYFKKPKSKITSLLCTLVAVTTLGEILVFIYKYILDKPYKPIYNFIIIFIFVWWNRIIISFWGRRKFNISILCIFLIFAIINMCFYQGWQEFNNLTFVFSAILFCIQLLYNIYVQYSNDDEFYLDKKEIILFSGVLVYHIGFCLVIAMIASPIDAIKTLYNNSTLITNFIYYGSIIIYMSLNKQHEN